MKTNSLQPVALLASFAACFAAAAIGAVATANAPGFYEALVRPSWAPPAALFGPVWTVLYTLMAIAAWIAWRRRVFQAAPTLAAAFALQLILNALWSWLFFRWHNGLLAFIDILVLVATVAFLARRLWQACRPASVLLWPYLLWITFAAALNFNLWRHNDLLV